MGDIDTDQWLDWMIASKFEERLLRYENEGIIVCQNVATFSKGSEETVLKSHLEKNGLLWRRETFATHLPPKK